MVHTKGTRILWIGPNEVMNGLAKPLVICRLTPNSMEKIKKMAMRFSLNREKARSPKASTKLLVSPLALTGHAGNVKV